MTRDAGSSRRVYLTTHQVARLLGVSLPTVVNWIEAGRISAHRTPGGHRRIRREELIRFSEAFSYPLPVEFLAEAGPVRVLIADPDPDLGEMLQDFLAMRGGYEVKVAQSAFDVGYLLGAFQPQLVMLDLSLPGLDVAQVLKVIREEVQARVYACSALRDAGAMPLLQQFDGVIEKPFNWEQLYETLRRAAS
jgi:excisionase family DNA binding protein